MANLNLIGTAQTNYTVCFLDKVISVSNNQEYLNSRESWSISGSADTRVPSSTTFDNRMFSVSFETVKLLLMQMNLDNMI